MQQVKTLQLVVMDHACLGFSCNPLGHLLLLSDHETFAWHARIPLVCLVIYQG
jgi:hypothetical protein